MMSYTVSHHKRGTQVRYIMHVSKARSLGYDILYNERKQQLKVFDIFST